MFWSVKSFCFRFPPHLFNISSTSPGPKVRRVLVQATQQRAQVRLSEDDVCGGGNLWPAGIDRHADSRPLEQRDVADSVAYGQALVRRNIQSRLQTLQCRAFSVQRNVSTHPTADDPTRTIASFTKSRAQT